MHQMCEVQIVQASFLHVLKALGSATTCPEWERLRLIHVELVDLGKFSLETVHRDTHPCRGDYAAIIACTVCR